MARRIFLVLLAFGFASGQEPAPTFPLHSITVEGNRILTPAGISAASGLKVGDMLGLKPSPVLDAARDRLLATGYFETVAYRFKRSGGDAGDASYEVAFEVSEMSPLYNLRIEALPISQSEIADWLKKTDPLFSGRIPGTQLALDRTAAEINKLLETRQSPVRAAGKVILIGPQKYEAQFAPSEGLPNVALVSFEGNRAIRDTELQNTIAGVAFGLPYTESNFRVLLDNQLKPAYEKRGYMRVEFGKLTTSASTQLASAQVKGIDVHVPITEGPVYKLGAVTVRGEMQDGEKHILRVAKLPETMKPGATLDFDEIRSAAVRIKDSLRHEGHLDADVTTGREINDEKLTVDVWFVPQQGPQYTFGKLEVKGLGLDGEAAMKKAWGLPTGEPYAAEYPDFFLRRVKEEGYFDNLGETRAEPEINAETKVVDVTLYFRHDPNAVNSKRKGPEDAIGPGSQGPIPGQPE